MADTTSMLLTEGLELAGTGVSVVFAALIVVAIAISIVGVLMRQRPATSGTAPRPLPKESFTGVSGHTLVLLAAAATVAAKRPVRIRRVRFVSHKQLPTSWAATARADHLQEHL